MPNNSLQKIDSSKREKFKQKLERLQNSDWDRESFESNAKEAVNAIENIDDFITGLQDDFDQIEGNGQYESDYDEIIENIGEDWYENTLQEKQIAPNDFADSLSLREAHEEAKEIQRAITEWRTLQLKLALLTIDKLRKISEGYKEEYVSAEVAGRFEDYAEKIIEAKMESKAKDIKYEFSQDIAELEQTIQAARQESKNIWEWHREFGEILISQLDSTEVTENLEEATKGTKYDQFSDDSGNIDLSGESQRREEKEAEREEAREAAKDDLGDPDDVLDDLDSTSTGEPGGQPKPESYEIKGKSIEDKAKVFRELDRREDIDLEEMSVAAVADLLDVSAPALSKNGGTLDQLEEELGHCFEVRS